MLLNEYSAKKPFLPQSKLHAVGLLGVAAAVANAIYHATGKRVRDLPIAIDKLL
jgi:hypothetical protein